jgi:hypothetical protein
MRASLVTLSALGVAALGSSGCAEVYTPKPTAAIVVSGNGGAGYRMYKNGDEFSGESAVGPLVHGDPRAEAEAEKASSERSGGFVLNLAGALAWGFGWGMIGSDAGNNPNKFPSAVGDAGIGLVVGGAVLWIVGGVLTANAHTHMFNAVNIYNDDVAPRSLDRPLGAPGSLAPPAVYVSPGPGYSPRPVYPTEVTPTPPPTPPPPPPPPPPPTF